MIDPVVPGQQYDGMVLGLGGCPGDRTDGRNPQIPQCAHQTRRPAIRGEVDRQAEAIMWQSGRVA